MELYENEEQQVEALKKWWQENATIIFIGVTLGIAVVLGWNYWQDYKKNQALEASALYNELSKAMAEDKTDSVEELAGRIESRFADTDYAAFSGLMLAKLKVRENDFSAAKKLLEKIATNPNKQLANLVKIRLMRLMLASKDYEQGLKLANDIDPSTSGSFAGLYDELVGDLYVALNRLDQARTSYQSALRNGQQSPLLQMKIDDLTASEKIGK